MAEPIDKSVRMLQEEIARQDTVHPEGYDTTRNGVRIALAAMEDEIEEAKEAWRRERREPEGTERWGHTGAEVLQVMALGARLLRDIGWRDYSS